MARLHVCDRCRNELSGRYTAVIVKPCVGVLESRPAFDALAHKELCDKCAAQLTSFLEPLPQVMRPRDSDGR